MSGSVVSASVGGFCERVARGVSRSCVSAWCSSRGKLPRGDGFGEDPWREPWNRARDDHVYSTRLKSERGGRESLLVRSSSFGGWRDGCGRG